MITVFLCALLLASGCHVNSSTPDTETFASDLANPVGLAVTVEGTLLVAESSAGQILAIDAEGVRTPLVIDFPLGTFFPYDIGPLSVFAAADGTIIVGEGGSATGDDRIRFFDASGVESTAGALAAPTGSNFSGLAIHPVTGDLYAASAESDRVFRAKSNGDGSFSALTEWISDTGSPPIGRRAPASVAVASDGSVVVAFADFSQSAIVRFDAAADDPTAAFDELYATDDVIAAVAIHPGSGEIYFAESIYTSNRLGTGRVMRLVVADDASVEPETFLDGLSAPSGLAFAADGTLYVALLGLTPNEPTGSIIRVAGTGESTGPAPVAPADPGDTAQPDVGETLADQPDSEMVPAKSRPQ